MILSVCGDSIVPHNSVATSSMKGVISFDVALDKLLV